MALRLASIQSRHSVEPFEITSGLGRFGKLIVLLVESIMVNVVSNAESNPEGAGHVDIGSI